jgi:ATP-binding cassette subfamily C protein
MNAEMSPAVSSLFAQPSDALPRQVRRLDQAVLLTKGSWSLFLHAPDNNAGGLKEMGEIVAPALLPELPALQLDGVRYQILAFPSVDAEAQVAPTEVPLDGWLNGASAAAAWWPMGENGKQVDRLIPRGQVDIEAGQSIASPALVLVRVKLGRLSVDGVRDEELQAGDLLALPREISLRVLESASLDVFRFGEVDFAQRMRCLQKLWLLSLKMAHASGAHQEALEKTRIEEGPARADKELESGIGALAGLVEGDISWIAPKGKAVSPLLGAARRIGAYLGIDFKRDVVRGKTDADTAADLAEANGVRCRQVLLSGDWWMRDNGPLLAFMAGTEEPLALLPDRWRRSYYYRNAAAEKIVVDADIAGGIKPYSYVFYRPLPQKSLSDIDLLRFGLRGYEREMIGVVCLAGVIGSLGLVVPLASARLMDSIIPAAQKNLLIQMGVGLLFVTMTIALFSLVRSLMVLRIQDKMDMAIQAAVWDRVLRMPTSFHRKYSVANLESRVRACQKIIRILSARTVASIFSGAFSALNFLVLFWFSASLSLLALGLVVLAAGAVTWFRRKAVRIALAAPDSPRKLSTLVLQLMQGTGKLRAAAAENRAFALWAREHALGEVPNVALGKLRVAESVFFHALDRFAVLILFAAAGYMLTTINRDHLSAGEFVGFFAAFGGVFHGVLMLCETLVDIIAVSGARHKARPILETIPEIEEGKTRPGTISGAIELNNVSFAYAGGPPVLTNVSFTARSGDFIAIVGSSGSGKSTLMRVLLGFERPQSGALLYDNKDVNELRLRELRRQFGVVLQDTRLLAGDILSNIVGDSGASLEDAWQCAEAAAVADDIRAMPMGMYTVIGDGVSTLSAGQRQRILLARALVRRPPILFLDEATNLLDGPSQSTVMRNLARMRITRIVIAHRISALTDADQILVLDNGKIAERGNYPELMAQGGLFREMVLGQFAEQKN